jgi:hypothetical protein
MGALSSLRAERSNPDFGAVAGLPRRFAARKDEILLRGFVSSCEPNLLVFSREGAKALRMQGILGMRSNIIGSAVDVMRLLGHNMLQFGSRG